MRKKGKLIIIRGLPASGKSTHALYLQKKLKAVIVNKDQIRRMLFGPNRANEKMINEFRDNLITKCLAKFDFVISDDTNIKLTTLRHLISLSPDSYEVVMIDTPLFTCIERDRHREYSVGEDVIRDLYQILVTHELSGKIL
jgi:predicted kinase